MENPIHSPGQAVQYFWQAIRTQITRSPHLGNLLLRRSRQLLQRFLQTYQALCRLPRPVRRRWQRQLGASLAGVALTITLGNTLLYAADITVTTNVPAINEDGQCSLIEAMINANQDDAIYANCAAGAGADTIILPLGSTHTLTETYGSVDSLIGLPPITSTITISGNDATIERVSADPFSILYVNEEGDLTLQETTITGGYSDITGGGAIYNAAGAISLEDSTVFSNTAVFGGGIFNLAGQLDVTDSLISGNTALVFGGGIFNTSGIVTLTHSIVSDNVGPYGGGGGIANVGGFMPDDPSDPPEVRSASQAAARSVTQADTQATIQTANQALLQLQGQAVLTDTPEIVLFDSSVVSNTTDGSGGGIINLSGNVTLNASTVATNTASQSGGGIINLGGYLTLIASTVATNTAECCGGGIYSDLGTVMITDSTVISNTSATYGGGIAGSDALITLSNSTVISNSAGYVGGGIDIYYGQLLVTDSTLQGNQALTGLGGGLAIDGGEATLIDTTLSGNWAAENGGGIAPYDALVAIERSTLVGNRADYAGGAISIDAYSDITIVNTTISANQAQTGGGIHLAEMDSSLSVADSTLTGNSATGVGGGLSINDSVTVDLARTIVTGNSATGGDEIYASGDSIVYADNFNLFGHQAQDMAQAFVNFVPGINDLIATSDGTIPTALANILQPSLANNGGDTQSHALVTGSPAIDAAGATGPAVDQRNLARPQGAAFDIGAFEVKTINSSVTQTGVEAGTYDATPVACGASNLATQTVTPTFHNNTAIPFSGLFFKVTTLEYKVAQGGQTPKLCNADVPGGGVGATLTITDTLAGNGDLSQAFVVGLPVRAGYRIFVDLYSTSAAAAMSDDSVGEYLGSFHYELDENGQLADLPSTLFLPLMLR